MSDIDNTSEDSIWGMVDANSIPSDPNFVEADDYWAMCTKSYTYVNDDQTVAKWVTEWTINKPESMYHGAVLSDWNNIPVPGDLEPPSPEMRKSFSYTKKRIINALNFSEDQASKFKPEQALGARALLSVINKNGYTNISKAINEAAFSGGGNSVGIDAMI